MSYQVTTSKQASLLVTFCVMNNRHTHVAVSNDGSGDVDVVNAIHIDDNDDDDDDEDDDDDVGVGDDVNASGCYRASRRHRVTDRS